MATNSPSATVSEARSTAVIAAAAGEAERDITSSSATAARHRALSALPPGAVATGRNLAACRALANRRFARPHALPSSRDEYRSALRRGVRAAARLSRQPRAGQRHCARARAWRSACRWRSSSCAGRACARALLGAASVVQTIPGLALLALFYPLLLALSALTERLFGTGFSALGFLPAVLALALYSMLPVLRNTVTGPRRRRSRPARRGARRRHDAAAIAARWSSCRSRCP